MLYKEKKSLFDICQRYHWQSEQDILEQHYMYMCFISSSGFNAIIPINIHQIVFDSLVSLFYGAPEWPHREKKYILYQDHVLLLSSQNAIACKWDTIHYHVLCIGHECSERAPQTSLSVSVQPCFSALSNGRHWYWNGFLTLHIDPDPGII